MFVFVVGDSLVTYLTGGKNARAGDDHDARVVAVHWNGGELTNRQLNDLVVRRRILNKFLRDVEMEGRRSSMEAGVDPPELRVRPLIGPENQQQQVEDNVVQTKLLADAASDSGMKVSDETLLQYLDDLGRKNVSREKMRAMLSNSQNRVSIDYVIDALREEMLAHNYSISHEFAFETVTPEQRWKDWLKVNDRIVVEAAAVPAESYLADVKEPTEAEITAFFDKYKDAEPGPDFAVRLRYGIELPSPTPGFRIPRKIDLQVIQANYDEFLTKAEAKVTDEEVAKYYDEHKDLFVKADTGLMEDKGPPKDGAKTTAPAPKDGANATKPADTQKKTTEPETKKAAEPAGKEIKSSEKKETAPASKEGKSDPKSSDAKKSSSQSIPSHSAFRLTAFEEGTEKKGAKADKVAEKSANVPAAKAETGAPKTEPAGTAPSGAKASQPAAKPASTVPADAPDASKAAPAAPAPKKPVVYQPLSEVKDQIRRSLAEGKVAEQLAKLTGDIQSQLDPDFTKWLSESLDAKGAKKDPPAPPKSLTDLAPLAQKNGLKDSRTGPKSYLEMRDLPVGKSSVADSKLDLLQLLFGSHELPLYQPVTTVDVDGNRFIVMKMSDTPGRVPTLAEVKGEVVKAWKKQRAAELAQKHAEELAKKAQEAKTPLTNFFAENKNVKVVRTDPFSELTGGDVSLVGEQIQQQPYRLSQPSELVAVGPDFLRRLFELKDGQVAVIPNNDHSIAYIVRVMEHQPGLPELRTTYLAEANTWYGESIMRQAHRQEVAENLGNDIRVRSNLKWDRDHDKPVKGEQGDEG